MIIKKIYISIIIYYHCNKSVKKHKPLTNNTDIETIISNMIFKTHYLSLCVCVLNLLTLQIHLTHAMRHSCSDFERLQTTHIFDEKIEKSFIVPRGGEPNMSQDLTIYANLKSGFDTYYDAQDTFRLATKILTLLLHNTQVTDPIFVSANFLRLMPGQLGSTRTINVMLSCYSQQSYDIMEKIRERTGVRMPTCESSLNFMLPRTSTYQRNFDIDKAHLKSLGIRNLDQYFGIEDAEIIFNTRFLPTLDFDLSDGIGRGKTDFLSVCLHELGHVLGFRSGVDLVDYGSYTFNPTILDIFRMPKFERVDFYSTFRIADGSGGAKHYIYNPIITSLNDEKNRFSTGVQRGNGKQASHWEDDSDTGITLGIMDPTLGQGRKEQISMLDAYALRLIGYEIDITTPPLLLYAAKTFMSGNKALRFTAEFVFGEQLSCMFKIRGVQGYDNVFSANYVSESGMWWCPYRDGMELEGFKVKGILTERVSEEFRF